MNNVCLTGRITKDPDLRKTQNDISYVMFSLAVDRKYKNQNGEKVTDFISCVAWYSQADFISKYVRKGDLLAITGTIQTRTYQTQNGENRYLTEVILDSVSNLTPKPKEEPQFKPNYPEPKPQEDNPYGKISIEDLPF